MSEELLSADVSITHQGFALSVRFETRARVIGLWGASGSGKTTFLEILAGLRRGARGRIALGTKVWMDSSASFFLCAERREVGYVPQDSLLFPNLDVRGNLAAGSRRAKGRGLPASSLVDHAVRTLRLGHLLDRDVGRLSGGERQRVALARALCSAPSLLLLDEPFASLDVPLRRDLLPILVQVREETRVPILLVSHDPTEIQILCDEVLALRDGRIEAQGKPREVLASGETLARERADGFENLIRGTIEESSQRSARVRLGSREREPAFIEVVHRGTSVGVDVFVGLSSRDIFLAKGDAGRLSARNRLPAIVRSIEAHNLACFVRASVGSASEELLVEITPRACSELELVVGDAVTLVFKASACVVYPMRAP